ncbi:MAG: sensor domain-containing diguanylate cyclase [Thermoguttaceae bacterium]
MTDEFVSLIQKLLKDRTVPDLPDTLAQNETIAELYNDLVHIRKVLIEFSRGDFSSKVTARGVIPSSLKSLQANLRHMAWQVQQVASGDFSQRVDFMGDFSTAFNGMVLQLEETTNELAFHATHDNLTGLSNRYLFEDRIVMHMAQCKRNQDSFILVLLDLDGFKPINDTYGHAIGDLFLIEFGKKIRSCLRDTDTVARLGGDEFSFIYECHRGQERLAATTVMKRLYNIFDTQPVDLGKGVMHTIKSSAGLCFYPNDAIDMKKLYIYADEALYESKRQGKNRYTIWNEITKDDETEM